MKNYSEIFKRIESSNPLPLLYEEGLTHQQVKEFIVVLFKPHFRNKDFFNKYPIEIFLDTWINFFAFRQKNQFKYTELILEFYNQCLDKDENYTLNTTIEYRNEFAEGLSKFWTFLNGESKREDFFELDDYLNYLLHSIGLVIEGSSKGLLKELFQLNKFLKGGTVLKDKVAEYDLGVLVNFLESTSFGDLFKPEPLNIKLSQLRNFSYHHNATLEKSGIIKCSYGKGTNKIEFNATIEELEETLQNILYYYNSIKLAREIFLLDNYDKIKPLRAHLTENPKLRSEGMLSAFYFSVSKEKFVVTDLKMNDDSALMVIKDITLTDHKQRAIHASQLLYNLWWYTDKEHLKMEYKDINDKTRMKASTNSSICEPIGKKEKELSYLAEKVSFDYLDFE